MAGKSTEYYNSHPAAKAVKDKYNTAYHATPERIKYRTKLNSERRRRRLKGNPKDLSHKKDGSLVLESKTANRARNGSGNTATKK